MKYVYQLWLIRMSRQSVQPVQGRQFEKLGDFFSLALPLAAKARENNTGQRYVTTPLHSVSICDSIEKFCSFKMPRLNGTTMLKFARLTDKAYAPMKGSTHAAGYDLRSAYEYIVPAGGKELVKTDLQVEVPEGTYGRIAPRSGLAWKNHIDVGAGVIDADYRGNVGVVLFNHSNEDFKISPGDRVAQLICEKIAYPQLQEVDNLDNTDRGEGGFGSTGKN